MRAEKEHLKLVIVGHLDHGKSTLIGRLLLDTHSLPKQRLAELNRISKELGKETELAYLSDQLKEEREQNKTIDTTQLFFKTKKRNYIIIDAPGHVEFIKNMLSGASLAEAGVLIIDSKEGIMEQTRRHAYLLKMLGIKKLILVFNKLDLINYDAAKFQELKNEFLIFLDSLGLKPLFVIPISAKTGLNISSKSLATPWYNGPSLLQALDLIQINENITDKQLRFSIQDVYSMDDEKIIAGKVLSGVLRQRQEIILMPSLEETKIKFIKTFSGKLKKASKGECVGLILENSAKAQRGNIIAQKEKHPETVNRFKGNIFWISDQPLEINHEMSLRCSTQEAICVAERIEKRMNSSTLEIIEEESKELKTNESALVTFKTENPILIEKFSEIEELGRFIIEKEYMPQGIGVVV
jgi:sulfate adenylyltransferase large subunit